MIEKMKSEMCWVRWDSNSKLVKKEKRGRSCFKVSIMEKRQKTYLLAVSIYKRKGGR